jgi:transcriptional regulator with XRE-family HTH domain
VNDEETDDVEGLLRLTGDRVRDARRSRHRGVADLAAAVGLGEDELAGMERGEVAIGSDHLCALADELDVRPGELRGYHLGDRTTDDPDGLEHTLAETMRMLTEVQNRLREVAEEEGRQRGGGEVIDFPGRSADES